MKDINHVLLLGRLGIDPKKVITNNGKILAKFTLATNYYTRADKSPGPGQLNQSIEHTQWHNIVAWGKTAEICLDSLHKGDPVLVMGYIRTHKYETSDKKTGYWVEVHAQDVTFMPRSKSVDESDEVEGDIAIDPDGGPLTLAG